MAWQGFLLAFCAAITHSCIDLLRKVASKRFSTAQCVCVVALLEGSLSFAFVLGQGTLTQPDANLLDNHVFMFCCFMSAALRLVSLLLYQTAIQLAPLSVTIPYLSFTPAMLIVTAYLMIGEQPSTPGLIGVVIVTLGGYLLAFSATKTPAKKADAAAAGEDEGGRVPGSPLVAADATAEDAYGGGLEMTSFMGVAEGSGRTSFYGALKGAVRSLGQLGDSKGSAIMLLVAVLWSLTSTFDKMGMAASPTLAAYLAVQRAMTAAPCVLYLALKDVRSFRIVSDHFLLVSALVASELLTVLLYLWSLKLLFVSYAVAAKRSGILLSVVSGWLFFGERIRDKIGYILLMVSGMLLIVLAPDMQYNLHLRDG